MDKHKATVNGTEKNKTKLTENESDMASLC